MQTSCSNTLDMFCPWDWVVSLGCARSPASPLSHCSIYCGWQHRGSTWPAAHFLFWIACCGPEAAIERWEIRLLLAPKGVCSFHEAHGIATLEKLCLYWNTIIELKLYWNTILEHCRTCRSFTKFMDSIISYQQSKDQMTISRHHIFLVVFDLSVLAVDP